MDVGQASALQQPLTKTDGPIDALRRESDLITAVENPFSNSSPWTNYEVFKAVFVGLTLFPIRVLVFLVMFPAEIGLCKLAGMGYPLHNDRGCWLHTEPLPSWRRLILWPVALTNRCILWALGFWHIKVVDKRRDRNQGANVIVVAPHQTITDPFMIASAFPPLPAGVGKYDLLKMPGMGAVAKAGQGIFVDRKNADSRHACKDAIAARADQSKWKGPPTLIFPEGTTTNGQVLIQYKLGPFFPGQPVLPVCLRYRWKHYNPGWCGKNSSLGMAMLRMMLQFANFCEIHILDSYCPSAEEKLDPKLFATNVRKLMAEHLGLTTTEHSYDDLFLMSDAAAQQGSDFEVAEVMSVYKFSFDQLKDALKMFEKIDKDKSGAISYEEFSQAVKDGALGPIRTSASIENLFSFFDTDGTGFIEYREFVQGLALVSNQCSTTNRAKLAFLIYDVEGKGTVKRGTLRKALNDAVGHTPSVGSSGEEASPAGQTFARRRKSSLGDSEEINFQEFAQLVESQPELLEGGLRIARDRLGLPNQESHA